MTHNRFVIRNDSFDVLTLNIEPEGAFFPLKRGEFVAVSDQFTTSPVTLKVTTSGDGGSIISIWPGDGDVVVEKDGIDVLDLLAQERIRV